MPSGRRVTGRAAEPRRPAAFPPGQHPLRRGILRILTIAPRGTIIYVKSNIDIGYDEEKAFRALSFRERAECAETVAEIPA
jgi:hypothetical protein